MTRIVLAAVTLMFLLTMSAPASPTVISVSPAAQSLSNPRDVQVVVTFGAAINPLSVSATTFQVFGRWSGVMSGAFVLENNDTMVRFIPDREFFAGEWITVSLSKGITDTFGDPMETGYAWNFLAKSEPADMQLVEIDQVTVRATGEDWVQTYGTHGGDLNGDGYSDLTAPNEQTNDVRVFLNDGNGGYSSFSVFPLPGPGTPSPNEGSDFNNDGNMDLAVGSGSGNTVNILLGDGAGGFNSAIAYVAASQVRGVAVLDLDGDGYSDVVTTNLGGNNISLFLNQGDGTFFPAVNMEAGGSQERACAAADANNDGIMDLFVGAYASNEVILLLGDGNGGLQFSDEIPAAPWMLAAGDVDGDGNVDVVSANSSSNNVSVIRGDGNGNLLPATSYASGGSFPLGVDLGDLDGDNDLDISVSNFSGIWRVYENDGAGNFVNPLDYPASSAASCTIFHDRDNDGIMDLTGVDEIDDLIFVFENASSGALCSDITSIQAKCQAGGTILFRVVLLNSTEWAGTGLTCTVDGDSYTSSIVTNGTHSRATFTAAGAYGAGDHTISVVDPPCTITHIVPCQSSDAQAASADWEKFEAEWEAALSSVDKLTPRSAEIVGNYPNPFNPTTAIEYVLPKDEQVKIEIHNSLGQRVRVLVDEFQTAGYKSMTWDGKNDLGQPVASGTYVYRITAGDHVSAKKMILLK